MSRLIPHGAVVAGLGRRFLAALLDALPFALIGTLGALVTRGSDSPSVVLVGGVAAGLLTLSYALYQWWAYATRGAGLGAQVAGIRVVSLADGESIGWWRVFLRHLVFSLVSSTIVGAIVLLVFLVIHERRQGWHDLAVGAVVVQPKAEATVVAQQRPAQANPVPPHLANHSSPQWDAYAPQWRLGAVAEPAVAPAPEPQAPYQPNPYTSPPASQPSAPPPAQWQAPELEPEPWQPAPPSGTSADTLPSAPVTPGGRRPVAQWIPLPTPTSVIEPSVKVRQRGYGEVDDADGTRIAQPAAQGGRLLDEGWYLRLDDGREVQLNVTVLLGRNPQKGPQDPEVHLVPSSGDGRMISRTHVLIGTDPHGVFIVDRGSTNGTAVVGPAGSLEPCPAGTQVRVREGQQVSYGNRWFTLLRHPIVAG